MKIFSKLSRKLRKTNSGRNLAKVPKNSRSFSNIRNGSSSPPKTRHAESLNVYPTEDMQTDDPNQQSETIPPAATETHRPTDTSSEMMIVKQPQLMLPPGFASPISTSHDLEPTTSNKLYVHNITIGKQHNTSTHKIHPHDIPLHQPRYNFPQSFEIRSTFHSQSQPQSRKNSSAVLSTFPRISRSFPDLLAKLQLIECSDTLGKLGILPLEILVLVLMHLDLQTIIKTVSVLSHAYFNLTQNDTLWYALVTRDYANYLDKSKVHISQLGDVSEDMDPRRKFPVISSDSKKWKDIYTKLYSMRSIGEKVVCHWTKDLYYWGIVERVEEADFYLIEFEDGDKRWALPHHLIRVHYGKPLTVAETSAESSEVTPHTDELRPVDRQALSVTVGSHVIAKFVSKNEAFFCHGVVQRIVDNTTCEVMLPYNQRAVLSIDCLVMTVDNTQTNIHEVSEDYLNQVVACEWNRSVFYIGKISRILRNEMFYYIRFEDGDASWIHHAELPRIEEQKPLTWREIHGRTILAPRFDLERGAYALATITVSCNDKNCHQNQSTQSLGSLESDDDEMTEQPGSHTCWMHSDSVADLDEDIIFLKTPKN